MSDYSAIPGGISVNEPVLTNSEQNPDVHHSQTSAADSLVTDPLVSAFDLTDSESDEQWVDDRVVGSNIHRSDHNSVMSSPSVIDPGNNIVTTDEPSQRFPRQFSLWNSMLNAISGQQRRENQPIASSISSDGVFGNLVAKEDMSNESNPNANDFNNTGADDENDDCTPQDEPPTYDEASADATPSYWETTILASNFVDEIIVGNMAVGSPLSFAWALLLCCAFGIPACLGFYLFHHTHSLKGGSFCGLGVNLIELSSDISPEQVRPPGAPPVGHRPINPNSFQDGPPIGYTLHPTGQSPTETVSRPTDYTLLARVVLAAGIFFTLKGIYDYISALRIRAEIRQQQEQSQQSQPDIEIPHDDAHPIEP